MPAQRQLSRPSISPELVRDVAELYEPLAETNGLTVECFNRWPGAKFGVTGIVLFQAASNLLDNAVKYSPPGKARRYGRMELATRQRRCKHHGIGSGQRYSRRS